MTSDGKYRYHYDDEGNRVKKISLVTGESTKYVWDHRNRLVQAASSKEAVAYTYDHKNRMTRRNDEFVVHDGWQIVLTLNAKGKVKDRNLWGANQDELIAANDQFTLCDHLGSVRDIVNADGKVTGHREYNAFGKVTKQTDKSLSAFGYTGKFFDNQTQLQWNVNRWYDAEVGRWISEDPIGFSGRDTHLLRYVFNNPFIATDIFGYEPQLLGDYLDHIHNIVKSGSINPLKQFLSNIPGFNQAVNAIAGIKSIITRTEATIEELRNGGTFEKKENGCAICRPSGKHTTRYLLSIDIPEKVIYLPLLQYKYSKGLDFGFAGAYVELYLVVDAHIVIGPAKGAVHYAICDGQMRTIKDSESSFTWGAGLNIDLILVGETAFHVFEQGAIASFSAGASTQASFEMQVLITNDGIHLHTTG